MGKGAKPDRGGFSTPDNNKSLLLSPSSSNGGGVSLRRSRGADDARIESDLDRPFGGGGGGGGPTGSNGGGANEAVVDHTTHHRDEYVSSSSPCLDAKNSAIVGTNSHPFRIFASYYRSNIPHKSPGEMVPFTSAQWKELERQAMIFKYMISSLPVPPHLLYPSLNASLYDNVGFSKNGALEPGRCKRTDGKKWRCSRDVAPHQKYCERHLHRGRPRSRKPVEVNNSNNNNNDKNNGGGTHKKLRLQRAKQSVAANDEQPLSPFNAKTDPRGRKSVAANDEQPLSPFNAKTDPRGVSTAPSHDGINRDLGLMMGSGMVPMSEAEQKWQHLLEATVGFSNEGSSICDASAILNQDYVDQQPLDHVLSCPDFPASEYDASISFIDAWSANYLNSLTNIANAEFESSFLTNHENFCPSLDLSIAMANGNVLDEEMGNVEMRDGVNFYDADSRYLGPVCWGSFGPGGPLAEALCTNPASPHDSISGPATTVSSPSGVLQGTMFFAL